MIGLPTSQRGFSAIVVIFLVLLVVILALGWFLISSQKHQQLKSGIAQTLTQSVTPQVISPWNTYQNTEYGFEVTYPKEGVIIEKDGFRAGLCGEAIVESGGNTILIDSFFKVQIIPWNQSIDDYMKSQYAFDKYNIQVINNSNTDEAIALKGLKPDVEYARGFPPLIHVIAIYKKGDKLFSLQTFQHPNNYGGCIPPEVVDPSKYPDIAKQSWNMAESLKFISADDTIQTR